MQAISTPTSTPNKSVNITDSPISAGPTTPNQLSPKIKLSKSTTASELLAAFSPVKQIKASSPIAKLEAMGNERDSRGHREKEKISYTISDDSDVSPSAPSSAFPTPQKSREQPVVDSESESVEETVVLQSPVRRISSAGHELRDRSNLHRSTRALVNGDKGVRKRKLISTNRGQSKKQKVILTSDAGNENQKPNQRPAAPIRTSRTGIRDTIASETATKRSAFFVAKKEYFLPLLPETNHITRLVEKADSTSKDYTVPYESIEMQPKGVTATMKPYQLAGLSFLVWLHKNGLSGILGDEMGLGKTLQTLSLFQYLKENQHCSVADDGESRPFLVVCPLSVLSSWISEAQKWTPGLKVLRFHGPIQERNRLKRVASGEEDLYGNDTRKARKKKNKRRTETGKPIICIDTDSEDGAADEAEVDVVVTTYETFSAEQSWFKKAFVWRYVVLDEGHKIKNDLTQVSTALQGLGAEYRLILTGTPLQNNLLELWALLHWLYPEVFNEKTSELFKSSFDLSRGKVSTTVMDDARRLLELIMLRRMKTSPGVDLNLPPKTEVLLYVPLTPMQRFWYTRLLTRADKGLLEDLFKDAKQKEQGQMAKESEEAKEWEQKGLTELEGLENACGTAGADWEESKEIMRQALRQEQQDEGKKGAWKKLMNLLMQLRKCCNHPYLLPHAEPEGHAPGDHMIRASGKFIVLDKLINELVLKKGKKVLIFSGFTRMLDCCEDFLALRGGDGSRFRFIRLDGQTARARRNLSIRLFNDEKSDYKVMLISTRAGGLGVNLATASDVVMLDQDWNPQIMLQAEARAHRIGQTKPVTVYKLCTQGTVEEQMMGRIQKKLYLSAKVTESMRDIHTPSGSKSRNKKKGGRVSTAATDDMPQLDTSQLMSLVRRGAQALSHPEIDVNEMLNWDWSTMLEKCKDKPVDDFVSRETTQQQPSSSALKDDDERTWLSQMERIESYVFGGKKYAKNQDTERDYFAQVQDEDKASRRIGKNTTVMIDGFAINKESLACANWEAVPTLAGKDPRLAEPVRAKRATILNQEHCQVCWDGGDLILCSTCPRSYHHLCLDKEFKAKGKSKMQFHCPQHQCADCLQKTGDAGGMLYRCRWCERAFCEDCLDWERAALVGENLAEYEMLGFPAVAQAWYIECHECLKLMDEDEGTREHCEGMKREYEENYAKMVEEVTRLQELENNANMDMVTDEGKSSAAASRTRTTFLPSRAESLTDATTLNDSAISTPRLPVFDESPGSATRPKRKAAPESFVDCSMSPPPPGAKRQKRSPRLSA